MANISTGSLIKDAETKIKERDALVPEIAALREILRNLGKAGQLSEAEAEWVAKAFPARETVKALRERAAELGIAVPDDAKREEILTLLGEDESESSEPAAAAA